MAPMAALGRKGALKLLRAGRGAWFGSPHPTMALLEQDGVWRIRQLVIDPDEAKRENEQALAAGRPWMPEHYYALGKPVGKIFVETATRDEMITAIENMDWPSDW